MNSFNSVKAIVNSFKKDKNIEVIKLWNDFILLFMFYYINTLNLVFEYLLLFIIIAKIQMGRKGNSRFPAVILI